MEARKLKVDIPADRRLVIQMPDDLPAGPAEIIVLVDRRPAGTVPGRMARIKQVMGSARTLLSSSDDFARRKAAEIELEEPDRG